MRALAPLLAARACLWGCPSPRPAPRPLPALEGICEPGIAACEARVDADLCWAAMACVDAREVGELCVTRLRACEALAAVDLAEQAAYRARAEERVRELESQRWLWGAVGVALGAVVVGLAVGIR